MSVAMQRKEQIADVAKDFADAVQEKNLEKLLSCFAEDCEVELFDLKLKGKTGVRKWYNWTYSHMKSLSFEKVHSMTEGNIHFEEYIVNGVIHNGCIARSRQMRSLVFEGGKVKTFRLYMDRLQFADSIANDFASKMIIKKFTQVSVKEMIQ